MKSSNILAAARKKNKEMNCDEKSALFGTFLSLSLDDMEKITIKLTEPMLHFASEKRIIRYLSFSSK